MYYYAICVGWLGILFKETHCFTDIRSPRASEILTSYELSVLKLLYPSILFATQIRTLVLYVFLLRVSKHTAHPFLSDIDPSDIPSPKHTQFDINSFTLQYIPVHHQWNEMYQVEAYTKVLVDRLSINTPLNESAIIKLSAVDRTIITHHLIGVLEGISFSMN